MKKQIKKLELHRETLRYLAVAVDNTIWSGYNFTCGEIGCTGCPGTGGQTTCDYFGCTAPMTCEYCPISDIGTACNC